MDLLSRAIDELGLRRSSFRRFLAGPAPWALAYDPGVQGVHVVVAGNCELVVGRERQRLEAGDFVVLPRGGAHVLRSLGPVQRGQPESASELVRRQPGTAPLALGVGPATCELVCGALDFEAKDHPMLASVGERLIVRKAGGTRLSSAALEALDDEVRRARAGTDAVITRLAELLFVEALRAHAAGGAECPVGGWFSGLKDPAIARALGAFHADIAAPWSVASLARAAAQSRAVFARRFTATLGETPLAYARRWRLFHARRLLRTTTASLDEVAAAVGYGSAPALSLAFSKDTGSSPGAYRAHHAATRE